MNLRKTYNKIPRNATSTALSGIFMPYKDYLDSNHWKLLKHYHYSLSKNKYCAICGSTEKLNVHHRAYKSLSNRNLLWREYPLHLITLCHTCHEELHKNFGNSRQPPRYFKILHRLYEETHNVPEAFNEFFAKHLMVKGGHTRNLPSEVAVGSRYLP